MNTKNAVNATKFYFKKYGLIKTIKKVFRALYNRIFKKESFFSQNERYRLWMKNNEPTTEELEEQRNFKFKINPKISVVVPMYNTPINYFKELVDCMKEQTYTNWELCLADGSPEENIEFKEIIGNDSRIKYRFLNENKGIAGNSNASLDMAEGDYIALLYHYYLLPAFCLYEIVKVINENPEAEFIYTDEDKIEEKKEKRIDEHFKPDFAIDTLRSNNYITHLSIFKKNLMEKLGGFKEGYNGAQDFDIILRASENTDKIVHIPKILYHWRINPNSTAMLSDSKPYAYEAGIRAIEDHLKRQGLKAKVTHGGDIKGVYEIQYEVEGNPSVSIIIPSKDNINLLKTCVNSILSLTTYNNYEILIVENNSTEEKTFEYYKELEKNEKIRVITYPEKGFNYSKIINYGVRNSTSDFVVQLNNDTKLLTPNWLEKFIGFAQRKDVGAVGARLYYEDKSIQHAGIEVGVQGIAANMYVETPKDSHAYFGRECTTRNVSAVTGACLFSRRSIYEEVGYMDEENFAVAFNDVDFCLKIREKGYLIVYDPYIEFIHYESKTRGYELSKEKEDRFNKEADNLKIKWKNVLDKPDMYSSINFAKESPNSKIRTDKIVNNDSLKG